jgi:hypothetical protein
MKTLVIILIMALKAEAVILISSGDPEYNTTPPRGRYANSGWQWHIPWMGCTGVIVGQEYFIASRHVGGWIGAEFVHRNETYRTVAFWHEPTGRDLTVWKVDRKFEGSYAPLSRKSDELGKEFVVHGRGTQRGLEVIAPLEVVVYATISDRVEWIDAVISGNPPPPPEEPGGWAGGEPSVIRVPAP